MSRSPEQYRKLPGSPFQLDPRLQPPILKSDPIEEASTSIFSTLMSRPQPLPQPQPQPQQIPNHSFQLDPHLQQSSNLIPTPAANLPSIGEAIRLPLSAPSPVFTIGPVTLPTPDRILDLDLRITAPSIGQALPIVVLSHGQRHYSINSSAPLAHFWAAHGFAVIEPVHLNSKTLNLDPKAEGAPSFWRDRFNDLRRIIDWIKTGEIEEIVEIRGRLDRERIAVAGHSLSGETAKLLLGERTGNMSMPNPRFKAGILLAPPMKDNEAESGSTAAGKRPMSLNEEMETPAIVVFGDTKASSSIPNLGPDEHPEAFTISIGSKFLLTLVGSGNPIRGVCGYNPAQTTDEGPERVSAIQRLSWAYMLSALYPGDPAWSIACAVIESPSGQGQGTR